ASGTPFTAPKSYYLVSGVIIPEYGEHNANRLRPYIRLDLSVSYSIVRNDRRECGLNFSLYNATARKNDLMYRLRVRDGRFAYRPMSFFMTLVPSVSYYHKF
ncbi:MAG: TonB-dependent receptor, partial [Bacteroidales bacterium]|nr:TonB-dependent receptor [Bacteroidales bacterium]